VGLYDSSEIGKRPVVRGVVMNPVDHPHGGGEGRAPIGRKKTHKPLGLSCTWKTRSPQGHLRHPGVADRS